MKRARLVIDLADSSDAEEDKSVPICSVCLDDMGSDSTLHRFPCTHELHAKCYDDLVKHANDKGQRRVRCPICRTEVRVRIRPRRNQVVIDLNLDVPPRNETRRDRVRRRQRERRSEMENCEADAEERAHIRNADDLMDESNPGIVQLLLGDGYGQGEVSSYESDDGFVVGENAADSSDDEESEPEYSGSDSEDSGDAPVRRRVPARLPEPLVSEGGRLMRAGPGASTDATALLREERRRLRSKK